jgi:hypothetical protein
MLWRDLCKGTSGGQVDQDTADTDEDDREWVINIAVIDDDGMLVELVVITESLPCYQVTFCVNTRRASFFPSYVKKAMREDKTDNVPLSTVAHDDSCCIVMCSS